jgi:hypothetical protein
MLARVWGRRELRQKGADRTFSNPPSTRRSVMPDSSTSPRVQQDTFKRLTPSVRSYLVKSQRRVIEHCGRLLTAQDLAADHRHRLTRLAGIAEAELQRLVD